MFTLSLGSFDFLPRGSTYTTRIKHPKIKDWLYLIFIKNFEGKITVFRANCPYETDKIIKNGLVFGNKVICEHHGCEFHIDTGKVEKYPSLNHLYKLDLVKSKLNDLDKKKEILAIIKENKMEIKTPKIEKSGLYGKIKNIFYKKEIEINDNVYNYKLPKDRTPLKFGKFDLYII